MCTGPSSGWQAQPMTKPFWFIHVMLLWSICRLVCLKAGSEWQLNLVLGHQCVDFREFSVRSFMFSTFNSQPSLTALAEKRDLGDDFKANIQKHLPMLRFPLFNLQASADWLEDLVNGAVPAKPLLDVSACLASLNMFSSY